MNTLDATQTYFHEKGYDTEIYTFKPEQQTQANAQLIIRGQKMPPIPHTNEPYYRVRVAICDLKLQWEVLPPYFQSPIKVNTITEAITLAESILESPLSERTWNDSMHTIEQAKNYLEAQGYSTEFLPTKSNRLVIYGLKSMNSDHPKGFDFGSAVTLSQVQEGWIVDRPFNHVTPKHESLDVAVVFAEDMLGPPFEMPNRP